eukprot:scaffold50378_cov70-Phaeocystis_antarctica.AAC.6
MQRTTPPPARGKHMICLSHAGRVVRHADVCIAAGTPSPSPWSMPRGPKRGSSAAAKFISMSKPTPTLASCDGDIHSCPMEMPPPSVRTDNARSASR